MYLHYYYHYGISTSLAKVAISSTPVITQVQPYRLLINGPRELGVGESATFSASLINRRYDKYSNISPATGRFTWSSSNPKVASISGTRVTALHAGTTTITVRYNNLASSILLRVVDRSTITFAMTNLTMIEGSKARIPFNVNGVSGTYKITWTSSNPKVATVGSSGIVTASTPGITTITATLNNNRKATCRINVVAKKIPLSDLVVAFLKDGVTFAKFSGNSAVISRTPPVADGANLDTITVKIGLNKKDKLKEVRYKWNSNDYKTVTANSVIELRVPKNTLDKNTLAVLVRTTSGLKVEHKVTINTPKGVENLSASLLADNQVFAQFDNKGNSLIANSGPYVKAGANIKFIASSSVSKVKNISYKWAGSSAITLRANAPKATINIPCPAWNTSETYRKLQVTVESTTGNKITNTVNIYKPKDPTIVKLDFINNGNMYLLTSSDGHKTISNTRLVAQAGDKINIRTRTTGSKLKEMKVFFKSDANMTTLHIPVNKTNVYESVLTAVVPSAVSYLKTDCLYVAALCEDGTIFKTEFEFDRSDCIKGDILIDVRYKGELYGSWSNTHGCFIRPLEVQPRDVVTINITGIECQIRAARYKFGDDLERDIMIDNGTTGEAIVAVSEGKAGFEYILEIEAITSDGAEVRMEQPIKVTSVNHIIDVMVGKKLDDTIPSQGRITPVQVFGINGVIISHYETVGSSYKVNDIKVTDDDVIYLRGMSTARASSIGLTYTIGDTYNGGAYANPITNNSGYFAVALKVSKLSANWSNGKKNITVSYTINGKTVGSTTASFIYEKTTPITILENYAGMIEELTAMDGHPTTFTIRVNGKTYTIADNNKAVYNNLNTGDIILYQVANNNIVVKDILHFREIKDFKMVKDTSNGYIQVDGFDYLGKERDVVNVNIHYYLGPEVPFKENGFMGVRQEGRVTFNAAEYLGKEADAIAFLNSRMGDVRGYVSSNDVVYLMILPPAYRPIILDEEGNFSLGHIQPYVEEPIELPIEPEEPKEPEIIQVIEATPAQEETQNPQETQVPEETQTPTSVNKPISTTTVTKLNGSDLSNGSNIGTVENGNTVVGEMERNSLIALDIPNLDERVNKIRIIDSMASVAYNLSEFPVIYAVNDIFNEDGPFELYFEYIDKNGNTLVDENGKVIRDKIVSFTYSK